MKTIAISTFGWADWECDAFEQYVRDTAEDFDTNATITHTTDHYFEVDFDEDDTAFEWVVLRAAGDSCCAE